MNKKVIERIGQLFERKLQQKTEWGRNEIIALYNEAVREVLFELIDEKVFRR